MPIGSVLVLQAALATLIKGRTTFMIAHRLHTLIHADRILVIRNGKIEKAGTHAHLMLSCPYYASLVSAQSNRFSLPRLAA